MTRKAEIDACRRICPVCRDAFYVKKPSQKQRCCGHSCAFSEFGDRVRTASNAPEARARNADARRGGGKGYVKRGGRHEHRAVAEEKLGRALLPGEIAHHKDENKQNNDPDNIEVLPSQAEHARLHFAGKKRPPKTHCKRGHALTPENTRITSIGRRSCLTCARAYDREWQKSKRRESHENPQAVR